ncbi:MAG: hypothetical protein U1F57_06225 [bacterium]
MTSAVNNSSFSRPQQIKEADVSQNVDKVNKNSEGLQKQIMGTTTSTLQGAASAGGSVAGGSGGAGGAGGAGGGTSTPPPSSGARATETGAV